MRQRGVRRSGRGRPHCAGAGHGHTVVLCAGARHTSWRHLLSILHPVTGGVAARALAYTPTGRRNRKRQRRSLLRHFHEGAGALQRFRR